ncbi:MAG: DUF11 domain-containing protein, partial [Methanobacteriaceae archaeon]|nr:DUF11 domain-containing protein [Methanobacteriaceae archaeon]
MAVDWDENEGAPAMDSIDLNIVEPSLVVTKTITPNPAIAGNYVTIRFDVTNVGNSTAFDVLVKDLLDGNIFDLTTVTEGNTPIGFTYGYSSPIVNYTGGSISNGTSIFFTFTLKVRSDVPNGTNHVNTVNVTSYSLPVTTNPHNDRREYANNDADNLNINTSADVYVTKVGDPGTVVAGELLTYTIVLGNNGPSDAQNVTLSDVVPGELFGSEFSLNGGSSWDVWAGSYTWAGAFVPGSSATVLIRGIVDPSVLVGFSNTASVDSDTFDPVLVNNTSTVFTDVDTVADIYTIKTDEPNPVIPGTQITYTIVVGNNGPSDAQNVVLSDNIPTIVLSPEYSTDSFTWNTWTGSLGLGTLSSGNSVTILIRGIVDASASEKFSNTASVDSDTFDPYTENNTSTVDTLIKTADIAIKKV